MSGWLMLQDSTPLCFWHDDNYKPVRSPLNPDNDSTWISG